VRNRAGAQSDANDSTQRLSVVFVVAHDSLGGAARAVYRIFDSIRGSFSDSIDIRMRTIHKTRDDADVVGGKPSRSRLEYLEYFVRTRWRKYFPRKPFVSDNTLLHSVAIHHSGLGRELNTRRPDVIMLGWLGGRTLSIPEIGRLKSPVVWRLSDMWMFSGAEHYTPTTRYAEGYSRSSRPPHESGPDLDRETFLRKKRHWKTPRHVITPSHWMAEQVQLSTLTHDWPVHVIPNPIDTDYWKPRAHLQSREALGLPHNARVIAFGTGGGTKHHHKGGDLLLEALPGVAKLMRDAGDNVPVVCVVFGEEREREVHGGIEVRFIGHVNDEELQQVYSAADVMVVPSRLDNLPSTAVEAQACGTPVVAFRVGGLPDIVEDGVTGLIVEPFDVDALSDAIASLLSDSATRGRMGEAARLRANTLWHPDVIARKYVEVLLLAAGRAQ